MPFLQSVNHLDASWKSSRWQFCKTHWISACACMWGPALDELNVCSRLVISSDILCCIDSQHVQ